MKKIGLLIFLLLIINACSVSPNKQADNSTVLEKEGQLNDSITKDSIEPVIGDPNTPEEIDYHLSKYFKDDDISVFHELVSDKIHVDIYLIKANNERNYNILMTSGMSSLPMNVPEEFKESEYAEIIALLPKDWPLEQKYFENENYYWPIRQLKSLARMPVTYNTWLGEGHTIANGDPAQPFADNNHFVGIVLLPSVTLPKDFLTIKTKEKVIHVYSMIPLYKEEMDYKLKKGVNKLLSKFNKYGIKEIIDTTRVNACKTTFKFFN